MSNPEEELAAAYGSLKKDFGLTDLDLRKPVSDIDLDQISSSLYLKWKRLPPYLGLKQGVADDIEHDRGLIKESEKRRRFLLDWKAMDEAGATYECLTHALLRMKCRADAEGVCKLLQNHLATGNDQFLCIWSMRYGILEV